MLTAQKTLLRVSVLHYGERSGKAYRVQLGGGRYWPSIPEVSGAGTWGLVPPGLVVLQMVTSEYLHDPLS